MSKNFFVFFAALLLVFPIFSAAVTDTYTTLNCAFSSPAKTITAKATYYAANIATCSPTSMTLVATLPNSTKVSYLPKSCYAGVHEFSIAVPVNGVYQLNASVAATTASCSTAALFFEQRPRLPEFHPALLFLTALIAVALLRRGGNERGNFR